MYNVLYVDFKMKVYKVKSLSQQYLLGIYSPQLYHYIRHNVLLNFD